MIGTASKGIIARDQQHNAQVYRQVFLPNPFMNETDDEIKEYMMGVHENCLRYFKIIFALFEASDCFGFFKNKIVVDISS